MCSLKMNVVAILDNLAKKFPRKPALIFKGNSITISQLRDITFQLCQSLIKLGVQKSDKVAIYLPNWPEYIYSYLAIWCIGATAVPLDYMLTEEELSSCINHAGAKILIAKAKPQVSLALIKEKCVSVKEIILCQEKIDGFLYFDELLEKSPDKIQARDIPDSEYACIFYTSGTTGRPKGVLCNYLQLNAPAQAMDYFVNLGSQDIALCGALPFSHLGGFVFVQAILFLDTTAVIMDRFIPLEILKNIQTHKVTCLWLVPSMYYAILQLKEFERFDLSSLKWVCCFGAPSSADQLRRFNQYCPQAELFHGWGMTETQGPSVVTPWGSKKIESIGKPAPWIEVKIFDENDQELPQDCVGEIVVKSWVVTEGYYQDPEATSQAIRSGWFHTGDLGRFDTEGDFYIVGRKKEMIKVSGEIVFEPEVESVIHSHLDVLETAVIGVPDSLRGEVPKAFVVLKEGRKISEEELRYFCRQHLAHFKIPYYFVFMASLPKTRSGKLDKEKLRECTT